MNSQSPFTHYYLVVVQWVSTHCTTEETCRWQSEHSSPEEARLGHYVVLLRSHVNSTSMVQALALDEDGSSR